MIVKELTDYLFDKVVLYTQNKDNHPDEYIDLFNGDIRECSQELLQMEVRSIGAKKSGVLDIRVE